MNTQTQFVISSKAYEWALKVLRILENRLKVKIRLHHEEQQLATGNIFLFNHFARFETIVPQYLIYKHTGCFSRSVADKNLLSENQAFSSYLQRAGVVPNNHARLLPFLAEEIFHNRKIVIFPEGGMVKDKQVMDHWGRYSIYSRSARKRRKHHAGAAVLGFVVEIFKLGILALNPSGERDILDRWAEVLSLASAEALRSLCLCPTNIVPAHITFSPLRTSDNVLYKGLRMLGQELTPRAIEELIIEGNILLKKTDMDLRLAPSEAVGGDWFPWERYWLRRKAKTLVKEAKTMDDMFRLIKGSDFWLTSPGAFFFRRKIDTIRDRSMRSMYQEVTVNIYHLISLIIYQAMAENRYRLTLPVFHRILYLSIKNVQKAEGIHCHPTLVRPEKYAFLLEDKIDILSHDLYADAFREWISLEDGYYKIDPELTSFQAFDQIRLKNLVAVYNNEVSPLRKVKKAVKCAFKRALQKESPKMVREIALHLFDDEMINWRGLRAFFSQSPYTDLNAWEKVTESGAPYLWTKGKNRSLGILLVHGFLASPAELKSFGMGVAKAGYPVMGVRLAGHGTSPWDLSRRRWKEWLESVQQGYRILSAFCDRVCVVGFSTGGALSLIMASEYSDYLKRLSGVVAVSTPLVFKSKQMSLVPWLHGANRFVRKLSLGGSLISFVKNTPEHPHINYHHIPIKGLQQLRLTVDELKKSLPRIRVPVCLIQGTQDQVVDAFSARFIFSKLGSTQKTLHMIPSDRHGILNENIGETRPIIMRFVARLEADEPAGQEGFF